MLNVGLIFIKSHTMLRKRCRSYVNDLSAQGFPTVLFFRFTNFVYGKEEIPIF